MMMQNLNYEVMIRIVGLILCEIINWSALLNLLCIWGSKHVIAQSYRE